jgi:CubicO group peptidase (beta-lactamase class C family)
VPSRTAQPGTEAAQSRGSRGVPSWAPGTAHGESPLFYGHLVGELVRRVDGRSIGRFLREEICGPNELDFAFGLSPAQQARAVDLTGLDEAFRAASASGRPALDAGRLLSPGMLAEAVTPRRTGPDLVFGHEASWGLGFAIDGDDGYGMGGLGGSYAGTSTAGGYTIAFVTGSAGNHDRLGALEGTLRDCLGLPPLP